MSFTEPPEGYTLFRDTIRGRSLSKPIEIQILLVLLFWAFLFAALWLWLKQGLWSMVVIPLGLLSIAFGSNALARLRNTPLAVNDTHPWLEVEGSDDAKVVLCTNSGWKDVGDNNLQVVPRQMSRELVITQDDDGRTEFGMWLYSKSSDVELSLHMSLVREAVALRNMFNGSGDNFENARIHENEDSGLLQREWLDTTPGQSELEFGALLRAQGSASNDSENAED
ncbi:MAG: hypothetical protein QF707_06805 [Candidatus Poseidoniaceae archaeon]|jgi:hypothetical protein|nr:hypothetical protein [Candidatus Poseidoniaceae archaeon]